MNKKTAWKRVGGVCMLVACFLLMMAIAIVRGGRIFGHNITGTPVAEPATQTIAPEARSAADIIATHSDKVGYAGTTPLKIFVNEQGRIASIEPLPNAETPSFFERATEAVIPAYVGLTPEEALEAHVDGATGATMSSVALKANIHQGMTEYLRLHAVAAAEAAADEDTPSPINAGWIAALVVALAGAILPLVWHNKTYRLVQQAFNVGVLGFWTGTFLSYASMIGFMANGMTLVAMLTPLLMLVTALIYPLFGRPNHYCNWICPLGALQELAGRCVTSKWHIGAKTLKVLTWVRVLLWGVLMVLMTIGAWFAWTDYELFAAFIVESAAWPLLVAAALVVLLSLVVNRPYCRFVCPTGTLFKIAEGNL